MINKSTRQSEFPATLVVFEPSHLLLRRKPRWTPPVLVGLKRVSSGQEVDDIERSAGIMDEIYFGHIPLSGFNGMDGVPDIDITTESAWAALEAVGED